MKKNCFVLILFAIAINVFAVDSNTQMDEITAYTRDLLISKIETPTAPYISDGFAIFTANKDARFVGIAFEHENYKIIHPFQRRSRYESDGEPVDSVLFYITQYPKSLTEITYRLVIDGLWTKDPLNPVSSFDSKSNSYLSTLKIDQFPDPVTEKIADGIIRFVYYGETGQSIRLGGSFNNWDSYMYQLTEVKEGMYQIELPLPDGTYYYNFYNGTNALTDSKNSNRSYSADGRTASVLYVD